MCRSPLGGIPAGMKVARIDIDASEMHRVRVDIPIVADSADAARALTDAIQRRSDPARAEVIAKAKADAWRR